jgi:hypothetical protein
MSEQIIAVLGIDLGKNSVSLTGLDATGVIGRARPVTFTSLTAQAASVARTARARSALR